MSPFVNVVRNQLLAGGAVTLEPGSSEALAFLELVTAAERMQAEMDASEFKIEGALRKARELSAELAWYADPSNYLRVPLYTQIAADKGARARAVLLKQQDT